MKRGIAAFYPDYTLPSVYELTPQWLKDRGFEGLILDIDNTLVSPDAPANQRARDFVRQMQEAGIACLVLSNNSRLRAESFARDLGCPFLAKAQKPKPRGFLEGAAIMGTGADATLVVGDQLFTDVYGAHRAGFRVLLVEALDPAHEQPFVRVKRVLEAPLRLAYRRYLTKNA